MATIALPRPMVSHRSSSIEPLSSLDTVTPIPATLCPTPVPNKHIPVCPPGPITSVDTPPQSPKSKDAYEDVPATTSTLYPPEKYARVESTPHALYEINAADVAEALDHMARQPLPEASCVFPWLHGLHPQNRIQRGFFTAHEQVPRSVPQCMRAVTVVKANGDLALSRLKGSIGPQEFMDPGKADEFLDVDPKTGFSVRNFQIQPAKIARVSDIIVYGDDDAQVRDMGVAISAAQKAWREKQASQGHPIPQYNTFICSSLFREFEEHYAGLVAVDSGGKATGRVIDFVLQERKEMVAMTKASEISHNVWLGPTSDSELAKIDGGPFEILIECVELTRMKPEALRAIAESPDGTIVQPSHEFPASGSLPTWWKGDETGVLETCKWIYALAHGVYPLPEEPRCTSDGDGDTAMAADNADAERPLRKVRPRKILIHCTDGYTESSLLAISYFSYSTGRPIPNAWLELHTKMRRNFFAYHTDVSFLWSIAPRLLHESPVCVVKNLDEATSLIGDKPAWFSNQDGSLPSRVLDYMYLGNLGHANNSGLLAALGIGQILSVGETASWGSEDLEKWGEDNMCIIREVQDNGIDSLTGEFERCLEFIDRGRKAGIATLVHCRVGVSRSATICIAEVMRSMNYSFSRAYCFVRARRLNVIIQPHLRFVYELLKWEETIKHMSGHEKMPFKRELEWAEIARQIALMNRPYSR